MSAKSRPGRVVSFAAVIRVVTQRFLKRCVTTLITPAAEETTEERPIIEYNSNVRKSTKKDKKEFINALTTEAETAAGQCNMKRLYEKKNRTMSGKRN